jgi:hypothetical protein
MACLSGCATVSGDYCDLAFPIRPSVQDVLTDGTVRQVLTHNRIGADQCGWQP